MPKRSPRNTTESLLHAAGGAPEDVGRLIDELSLEKVAPAVLDELLARVAPPAEVTVDLLLELHRAGESVAHTLSFTGGRLSARPGREGEPGARIRYEAADLVTALYGPAARRGGITRQVESLLRLPGRGAREDTYELFLAQRAYAEAIHSVIAAVSATPPDLSELSVRFGSDKWGFLHWFTEHYAAHFRHLVDEPIRLLEIGIGGYDDPEAGGGSLRVWQRYFRRGLVVGLDLYEKTVRGPRIQTVRGDQGDRAVLADLAERVGPFDVVIDDGSHVNSHVLTSFEALFPHVRDGGLYVIEDFHTTYWPGFGGAVPGPDAAGTVMGRLKELLDGLHHPEFEDPATYRPSSTDLAISAIHFYRNLVFIEKGLNTEGAPPSWMPREPV
ncbi:class I SAM-dependent methyltransferase [Actinosynnema sp. NPDC023587]|uniref:class I SAM-dependent methyltransferase n=1 Tax=Actinosynnema sp. NPDC023587 TaxID=3154695 RepID=UPI0034048A88